MHAIDWWLDRTIPSNRTFPERFYQRSDLLEILPKKVWENILNRAFKKSLLVWRNPVWAHLAPLKIWHLREETFHCVTVFSQLFTHKFWYWDTNTTTCNSCINALNQFRVVNHAFKHYLLQIHLHYLTIISFCSTFFVS